MPNGRSNFIMDIKKTNTPDADLITEYLKGSETSLEKLINRHQLQIFNFINSKVNDRDKSEDIFQDTFIKVIRTLKNGLIMKKESFYHGLCA